MKQRPNLLVIAALEQASVRGVGDIQRHGGLSILVFLLNLLLFGRASSSVLRCLRWPRWPNAKWTLLRSSPQAVRGPQKKSMKRIEASSGGLAAGKGMA